MKKSKSKLISSLLNEEIFNWQVPIGRLEIVLSNQRLKTLSLVDNDLDRATTNSRTSLAQSVNNQLQEYFAGKRHFFDIPLDWQQGTSFQRLVWQQLQNIPYGKTSSYLEIAQKIDNPKAVRAVGQAIGKNPWLIIVPCHRVIGHNGKIGGFSSGIKTKEKLLALEDFKVSAID